MILNNTKYNILCLHNNKRTKINEIKNAIKRYETSKLFCFLNSTACPI